MLIRHGQSDGNQDNHVYHTTPDFAVELTKKGQDQAKQAAEIISNQVRQQHLAVYISPYFRTRQTYDEIKYVLDERIDFFREDPRLREQDFGHLRHPDENLQYKQERKEFSPFYYRIKDGESGADVYDRISSFFDTLHRDFNKPDFPESCLIVTHGLTMRLFLMRWFHWSIEEFESTRNPKNTEIWVLEKGDDEKYVLSNSDVNSHITDSSLSGLLSNHEKDDGK